MNEKLLQKLYEKYGMSQKGTFEQFKTDMSNPDIQRKIYDKYGLSEKGSFEQFQSDLKVSAKESAPLWNPITGIIPQEFTNQAARTIVKGAARVVPDVLTVLGAGEQQIKNLIGEEGTPVFTQAAQATEQGISDITQVNPEFEQSLPGQVLTGVGQVVPLVATSGVSQLGAGARLGTEMTLSYPTSVLGGIKEATKEVAKKSVSKQGALAGAMNAAPEWEQAKAAGLSDEDAFKSLLKNYFVGITDTVPVENSLKKLNAVTGNKLLDFVKASGTGGFQEFFQEGIQTYLTNQFAKEDYDPDRDPMFQVLESAKVGGIVGLLIPSIGIAMQKATPDVKQKLAIKVAELEATQATKEAKVEAIDKAIAEVSTGDPTIDAQQDVIVEQVLGQSITPEQRGEMTAELNPGLINEQGVLQPTSQPDPYLQAVEAAKQSPNLEVTEVDGKLRVKILNEAGSAEAQNLSYLSKARGAQQSTNVESIPSQESTVKGDIREAIRPSSETVKASEYSLLKDKIRNIARGVRMGNIDAKNAVKEVGKNVSEIIERQQLPAKQQNSIIRRATSVNFNNPSQVEKLFTYVDKVTADAQYEEKLGKAKSRAKAINSKRKGGKFASFTPMVQRLLQIDPETLSNKDLETYQTVLDELDNKVPNIVPLRDNIDKLVDGSFVQEETKNITTAPQLREYVAGIEDVIDYDSFSAGKRRLNQAKKRLYDLAKSGAIDETEAESFALEMDAIDARINEASAVFEEQSQEFKKERGKQAKDVLKNLPDYSKQDTEQIEKFKKIDLRDKSVAEVEDYYNIAEGLSNGFINKAMYDYISKSNKQERIVDYKDIAAKASAEFAKVRSFFGLFNVKGIDPVKDPRKLLNELKLLHGQRWDRKFLLGKDRPIQEKIFTPINAKTKISESETNSEQKKAKMFINKLKENPRIKIGMILNQLDYQASKQEGQPQDKMRFLLNDSNSYEDAKPVMGIATLDKYKEIWNSLPKDANGDMDVDASIASLTPEERKALNGMKDEVFGNEEFQGKTKVITEMRGEVWEPHADYFPNYVRQRVRKGKDADTATDSFVDDALALDRKGLGVRSGRTYQRTGQLYFTELDVTKVADQTIKEVNRDYYLTEAIRDNIGAMNQAAAEMVGEQRGMFDSMYQAMKDRVVTEYNLKFSESDPLHNFMDWYLSFRRTMALSNPLRMPYDFTANMVRQGIAEGFNAGSFSNPLWAELKKDNDSVTVGKTNKYKQEQVRPSETKAGQLADELMGLGDVPVVNISYITSFKNKFKELTGNEFNIAEYNNPAFLEANKDNIRKASSFADAKVQDLFNSQTTFMAPSKTKITPLDTQLTDKKAVVAKMFGFMQSFTTNESAELMQSFKDLAYGTNEGRVKAARRMAALGMSNYVYMNGALVMLNMLRAAVDDEEEFIDLLEEQFSAKKQFEILLASFASLAVGRYGNLVRPILSLALAGMYDILKRGEFDNPEELKEDLDAISDITNTSFYTGYKPLNLRYDKPDKVLRLIPTLGDALGDAVVLGNSVTDLMNKNPETMEEVERAQYDMLILLNKTAAFAYKNPVSPTIDRLLRAKKSSISNPVKAPEGFIEPLPELQNYAVPDYQIPNYEIPQY